MRLSPKGEKRAAVIIGNAVLIARIMRSMAEISNKSSWFPQ